MKTANSRAKKAIWTLWIIMFLNIFVAAFKIIIGTIVCSGSILADGYHSLSDGSGNIVGIVGLSIAGRPIDNNHPYGHKKFETISSMIIGFLLFAVASEVLYNSILHIIQPKIPRITTASFVIMIFTLCINFLVTKYEHYRGIKLCSDVLLSDSQHTKSDLFITTGVLITMLLLKLGCPPIVDGIVSGIIALFIYKASISIFLDASNTLTDTAVLNSDEICAVTMSCDGVMECHKIRSRGRRDEVFIDLHIMVTPDMQVTAAHNLQHKIENELKSKFGNHVSVIIHVEPFV